MKVGGHAHTTHIPQCSCGGWATIFRGQFQSSIIGILGTEFMLSGLETGAFIQ